MRVFSLLALLLLALSLLAACGGGGGDSASSDSTTESADDSGDEGGSDNEDDSEDGDDETSVAQPSGNGQCDVQISGDLAIEGTNPGGASAFGSDYYIDDDEMRDALETLARALDSDASDEEIEQQVEEGMASDPRFFIVAINCVTDDYSISLLPSAASKYADVPFGPGTYPIAASSGLAGDNAPGEFGVLMTIGEGLYEVSEPGELRIDRWDNEGIAGSFEFNAVEIFADEAPKSLGLAGTFEFDCSAGSRCDN